MKLVYGIALPDFDKHFSEHLEREVEHHGAPGYQTKKWKAALPLVPRLRHAIDVGAHVGLWSRQMAKAFDAVSAFEPIPALNECFLENLKKSSNVRLYPVALGAEVGRVDIVLPADNSGNGHVVAGNSFELRMLDEFKFEAVDFIKIDVEGGELDVVRGAEETIRKHRPVMVVEQKPDHGARFGNSDTAAVELLQSWGADIAWIKAGDYALVWK